ncbi:hypothetical protein KIN20_002839 [Parelaphostrongylus tenuis]|uniref:Uncharacterized protein n=1 Tax=Parelaphostrongylus tenuis TaxID=148309 RepID=A0AAD5MES4_PARTN|nr:hypothetical protein KIN20_002839 [Parelaphostrongylus tenuis]
MAEPPTLLILMLATVAILLGCGVMPQGKQRQETLTVSGFRLPTAMVFTASADAPAAAL